VNHSIHPLPAYAIAGRRGCAAPGSTGRDSLNMERIAPKRSVVFRTTGFDDVSPSLVDLESTTPSAAVPDRPPASVVLMPGDDCGPAALTSVVRALCYTLPCCCLRVSSSALRSSMSAFDLAILSGWWYRTRAVGL
jgi:hypothetical protein